MDFTSPRLTPLRKMSSAPGPYNLRRSPRFTAPAAPAPAAEPKAVAKAEMTPHFKLVMDGFKHTARHSYPTGQDISTLLRLIDDHADFFDLVNYPADMNGYDHDEVMQVAHELYFHGNKQIHTVDEIIKAAPSISSAPVLAWPTPLPEILGYIADLFDLPEKWVRRSYRLSKKAPVDYRGLEADDEEDAETSAPAPQLPRRSTRLAAKHAPVPATPVKSPHPAVVLREEYTPIHQKIDAARAEIEHQEKLLAAAREEATKLYDTKLATLHADLKKEYIASNQIAKGPAGIILHLMFEHVNGATLEDKVKICSAVFKHIMNTLTVPLATHPRFRQTCCDKITELSNQIDTTVANGKVAPATRAEFNTVVAALTAYMTHILPNHPLYSTVNPGCPCAAVGVYDPDDTKSDNPDRG
jgi:hypothetical protein